MGSERVDFCTSTKNQMEKNNTMDKAEDTLNSKNAYKQKSFYNFLRLDLQSSISLVVVQSKLVRI